MIHRGAIEADDGALYPGALRILLTADPWKKAGLSRTLAAAWRAQALPLGAPLMPPDRPRRPDRPRLLPPRDMPKRRKAGSRAGRIALLHALAHIELNAIDLACDILLRFAPGLPAAQQAPFVADWLRVADEEAKHFLLLSDRLAALDARYGDLPAHDGLWQAAADTAHDLAARLALVPLVLEARGLDVTPAMITSLTKAGDADSAAVLQIIHDDEIGHVAVGRSWFAQMAESRGADPQTLWQSLVRRYFNGQLKRPFNTGSRDRAGFPADWYEPLAVYGSGP